MKTTLNIRMEILEQIARAAQTQKMSCFNMIFLLINKSPATWRSTGA
jgi:hypothetical protein